MSDLPGLSRRRAKITLWALALTIWAPPAYVLGHEATHCGLSMLDGAEGCTIALFGDCAPLTSAFTGQPAMACARYNDGRPIPQPFAEVPAVAGGIAFALLPFTLPKLE